MSDKPTITKVEYWFGKPHWMYSVKYTIKEGYYVTEAFNFTTFTWISTVFRDYNMNWHRENKPAVFNNEGRRYYIHGEEVIQK